MIYFVKDITFNKFNIINAKVSEDECIRVVTLSNLQKKKN